MAIRPTLPPSLIVLGQLSVMLLVLLLTIAVGYVALIWYPADMTELIGVVLVLILGIVGIHLGGSIGAKVFPGYNVGEVAVEGLITRDGGRPLPSTPGHPSADEIVDQIERADADSSVHGLLVKLNTPGGEVVPSDDIRAAVERFDGPAIAYTTDICASGGYWIASGCDELWARDASVVGSIGVRGSRLNINELADRLGISHERFTAGRYKDAGSPFREMEDYEREYIQNLIDQHYETFIDRVTDGRELAEEDVRATEARVYLGEDAHELGLVDELGDHLDVKEALGDQLGIDDVRVRVFEPERPLVERFRVGIERISYALGAGIASHLVRDEVPLPERS